MYQLESVQYFQFDSVGNMYVYPAGLGFSGIPQLVQPGDEIFGGETIGSSGNITQSTAMSGIDTLVVDSTSCSQMSVKSSCSFKKPLDDEKMEDLRYKNFSPETMKKVKWAVTMYRDWRNYQNGHPTLENVACDLDDKSSIMQESLTFALSRFITEVKKLDGTDFPGKTLYEILISVQFHLETIGLCWKLLNEERFSEVKFTLDNMMKLHTSQGIGNSVRKAEILSKDQEEILWSLGLLGYQDAETLLNTVVFMIGKGFALRAGEEHQAL